MPYSIVTLTQHAANKLTKPVELSYRELKDEFQGTGQLFEDPAFDASYYSCFGSSPNEDYNLGINQIVSPSNNQTRRG